MGEMWSPVETVFQHLVGYLPDNYIVVDQTLSGAEVSFTSGPDNCVEYGVLVLAPGVAVQVQVSDYGDLLAFEEFGSSRARITYLCDAIRRRTQEVDLGGSSYEGLDLMDVVQWIAQSDEEHGPEMRAFFAKLKVVETTVAAYATSEWDEPAAQSLGLERLHTRRSIVERLQQLEESVVFSDCEWTEDRVRTLVETLGGPFADAEWDWSWDKLKDAREAISRQAKTPSEEQLVKEISSAYPFPLAFSFRRFETEAGYPEKLRCAENVLAYLGSLGIALAWDAGLSLGSDEGLGKHLKRCWRRGMSAGHWVAVVRETTKGLQTIPEAARDVTVFPSVYRKDSGGRNTLGEILEDLPRIRNDFHHHRYPTSTSEYEEAGAKLREKLMTLYVGLRFFEAFPLWYVMDCAKQRGSSLCKITYKLCIGDNAQFTTLEAEVDQCLYRGSVYVKTAERLVDLTPWIVLRTCPMCGSQAMFFVEGIDADKEMVTYKSFNRGHTDETDDHWDLISSELAI
jgi:hypothetical protein